MDWLFFAVCQAGGLIMNYARQTIRVRDADEPVVPPVGKISIIIPAYNEELYIEQTIASIQQNSLVQQYPDMVEIIVVDNESTDRTVEIAEQFAKVISAPRGKLNARHAGIEASSGEIIVNIDADVYVPPNFLNLLLRHFHDPDIVGVAGALLPLDDSILRMIWQVELNFFNNILKLWMNGGGMALRKSAYYEIGGFNLTINQFDRIQVSQEEEIGLARRLQSIGKIKVDAQAGFFASARGSRCKQCGHENHPGAECQYCREAQVGQRF